MLRKSMFGVAMVAIVSATGVYAADAGTNGAVRNQSALAVAGRITPQMRAVAQQCAAVVGKATRTPCAAGGSSHLVGPEAAGALAVTLGATATVIWAIRDGTHNGNTNAPTPIPVSS